MTPVQAPGRRRALPPRARPPRRRAARARCRERGVCARQRHKIGDPTARVNARLSLGGGTRRRPPPAVSPDWTVLDVLWRIKPFVTLRYVEMPTFRVLELGQDGSVTELSGTEHVAPPP